MQFSGDSVQILDTSYYLDNIPVTVDPMELLVIFILIYLANTNCQSNSLEILSLSVVLRQYVYEYPLFQSFSRQI